MTGWSWKSHCEWNERGKLIFMLPNRDHMVVRAEIEDCDGDYGYYHVWEDNLLVATGQISSADPLWRNGDGPKLEAERVVCYGANELDKAHLAAYLLKHPYMKRRTPHPKEMDYGRGSTV